MKLKGMLVLIAVLCLVGAASAQWAVVNISAPWSPRLYHSSVALSDGTIVLMGGDDSEAGLGTTYNDVWNSTDDGATWTLVTNSAGWSARESSTAVVTTGDNIVLMGGETGFAGGALNETWLSSDGGLTWTEMNASSGWSPRLGASSVALSDGSIILMGGTDRSVEYNDTWRSADNGTTWVLQNPSSEWVARAYQSSVVFPLYSPVQDNIVLMGGTGTTGLHNDTWISPDLGVSWTLQNVSSGWTARKWQSGVVLIDDSIFLFGGLGDAPLDEWKSTDYGVTWTFVSDTPWSYIYGQSAVKDPNTRTVVLSGGYPFYPADVYNNNFYPAITSISPTNGTASGGTVVNITGSGFTGAPVALFGSTYATGLVVISDTEASAISPAGTGIVHVRIATTISTSPTSAVDLFTYDPSPPAVTSISPTYGTASGGTVVNITGSGFTGASSVYLSIKFGIIPGSGNVFISDTEISSISPPGTGTVHITVETPNGTSAATTADLFTYGIPAAIQNANTLWSPHQVVFQCLDGNNNPIINTPISALASYTTLPGGMANAVSLVESAYGLQASAAVQLINSTTAMSGVTDQTGSAVFVMLPVIAYNITFLDATGINYTTATPIMPQDSYYQLNTRNATIPSQANLELAYVAKMNASIFNTTYSQTTNGTLGTMGMYIYDSTGQTGGANCWWTLIDNSTTWWDNRTWALGSGLQTFGRTVVTTPFQQWKWGCSTL